MSFYGYVRVSTETQAEKGYGLEAQRIAIESYAKEHGITIVDIFKDAGISGKTEYEDDFNDALSKREGLLDLIGQIQAGDTIIVLNTNRLWRSDMTKAIILHHLRKRKANIKSIEQDKYDVYAVNPNDKLIAAIMEALDEWDRDSIALKLARGRTVKARSGNKPAGTCPYGYNYSTDKKSVIVNEDEAKVVKLMFKFGQMGRTLQWIADNVNATGALSRHGKPFSKGTIAAILNNRFYIGELQHQGQTIKGNQTPIISKVQFGRVQAQLEKRKRG